MPLMKRPGEFAAVLSMREKVTAEAGASALSETKTRPAPVATQSVPVFWGARAIQATAPPARLPYLTEVRSVFPDGPICTKSPHAGLNAEVVNSGQLVSR